MYSEDGQLKTFFGLGRDPLTLTKLESLEHESRPNHCVHTEKNAWFYSGKYDIDAKRVFIVNGMQYIVDN